MANTHVIPMMPVENNEDGLRPQLKELNYEIIDDSALELEKIKAQEACTNSRWEQMSEMYERSQELAFNRQKTVDALMAEQDALIAEKNDLIMVNRRSRELIANQQETIDMLLAQNKEQEDLIIVNRRSQDLIANQQKTIDDLLVKNEELKETERLKHEQLIDLKSGSKMVRHRMGEEYEVEWLRARSLASSLLRLKQMLTGENAYSKPFDEVEITNQQSERLHMEACLFMRSDMFLQGMIRDIGEQIQELEAEEEEEEQELEDTARKDMQVCSDGMPEEPRSFEEAEMEHQRSEPLPDGQVPHRQLSDSFDDAARPHIQMFRDGESAESRSFEREVIREMHAELLRSPLRVMGVYDVVRQPSDMDWEDEWVIDERDEETGNADIWDANDENEEWDNDDEEWEEGDFGHADSEASRPIHPAASARNGLGQELGVGRLRPVR